MRLAIAALAFLSGATALLVIVAGVYLLPAYDAYRDANQRERSLLAASSTLLLAVVLVLLLVMLVAALGLRNIVSRDERGRTNTRYVDAWQESARRTKPSGGEKGGPGQEGR
ncbi:MAG: hypothetical protein NZ561_10575 [Phycisphaerae bacterium]|nr:hypothetical protein [Phycisphaerae bacterium]